MTTHTFALLPVSGECYREIAALLRQAGYGHCFVKDGIDMGGIALTKSTTPPRPRADYVAELNYARAFNDGIEAAALVASPRPHIEEERECEAVAAEIRALVLPYRGPETEVIFARRTALVDQRKRTRAEEAELQELREKIAALPTARTAHDQAAMDFLHETVQLIKSRIAREEAP